MARASNLLIGTLTLALIAGSLGGWLGYQRYAGIKRMVPFRVIFEGSASGLRRGASVNFAGVRIGEVVSIRLDRHRVVAMTRIDGTVPIKKDTQAGLEFQGLTGIASISFTGGAETAPPPALGADGIPELTADADGTMGIQEKLRVALRNVDRVITENEADIKDSLLGLENFTNSLSGNGELIAGFIDAADDGISAVDAKLTSADKFLKSFGSDKYGGELLPTVISLRELIQSFDKKSGAMIAETRRTLGDVSQSVNKFNEKFVPPAGRR
ncbi:MlaD family protein [Bradyrhizobium sp. USDA 3364]